eukprot:CAMPEP_0170361836 /NCGR_PEP_ID=MMETSP0117_2-20130122/4014_1 /TAXON_ID=400756 /ORGANISM="Durinskia baltica, Strain CSIRO CS-38" /LENGTH=931 /DNA_ID=CAMNT_0010616219 /DNA_START=249 /DNA_END=3044 /DNA_ORIENTATION=-
MSVNAPILTVMSSAQDDFNSKYEIVGEIGKGGFSTVYQCRARSTGLSYAVKVVDLRPLRLRERFNPARLRREVDIMKRLHHPNIIQFVDVFEDADHLMMIMEFCPGQELFDVILNRKYFQEEDAKPIFAQVARALFYLHSVNILHRDVKPENVLISNIPDPQTGGLVAKLLDFGLSKNAGNGSAAKTFVGTPCYVAPEVEYTSKGLGGTYSFPADCWSLGAVLYVMLVARFPEFEQDMTGKVVVKMNPALWGNVSNEAKDLIRGLMNTNPAARLTMSSALMHPWLGRYRATQEEISRTAVASYDLNRAIQEEESRLEAIERERQRVQSRQRGVLNSVGEVDETIPEDMEITASGVPVHHQAMVVRVGNGGAEANAAGDGKQLQLAPLLHLQRSIAECFDEVHAAYKDLPDVASEVRQGASLCREQLTESTKMLRKVEQTAAAVLQMFPDLELAVEEGEPQLAADFFGMVKGWVAELREMVNSTQGINKASMFQIQQIVERSTIGLLNRQKAKPIQNKINVPKKLLDTVIVRLGLGDKLLLENAGSGSSAEEGKDASATVELDANHVMELFMSLFGSSTGAAPGQGTAHGARTGGAARPPVNDPYFGRVYSIDSDSNSVGSSTPDNMFKKQGSNESGTGAAASKAINRHASSNTTGTGQSGTSLPSHDGTISLHREGSRGSKRDNDSPQDHDNDNDRRERSSTLEPLDMHVDEEDRKDSYDSTISFDTAPPRNREIAVPTKFAPLMLGDGKGHAADDADIPPSPGNGAAAKLAEALQKLRQVDEILEELSVFWANTEVVLDLLTKKGQHVEQFIGFASKPRLMARFRERMEEYKRFWENVSIMCSNYIAGVQTTNDTQRMYGFLESEMTASVSTMSSLSGTPSGAGKASTAGGGGGGGAGQSGGRGAQSMLNPKSPEGAAVSSNTFSSPFRI